MVSGFARVLAPGVLLVISMTTTTILHPAGTTTATASSTTRDDDDVAEACRTPVADCRADETCLTCLEEASSSSTPEILSCYEETGVADVESSTASCADYKGAVCCLDEVSELECLENDAFTEYWACFLELTGCSDVTVTCDGDTDIDEGVDNDDGDSENDDGNDVVDSAESASNGATAVSMGHNWTVLALSCLCSLSLSFLGAA